MIVLGIETATSTLGAALVSDDGGAFLRFADVSSMHCELLPGFIYELISEARIKLENLDSIAVSVGPGSFTGLRIGISTAAGLAFGLNKKVAEISTLAAIAYGSAVSGNLVCPVIDAKRSEVYAGIYRLTDELTETVMDERALSFENLAEVVADLNEKIIITGPAAVQFAESTDNKILEKNILAGKEKLNPSALSVAKMGLIALKKGLTVNPAEIKPIYLRRSDAELARDAGKSFFQKKI